MAGVSKLNGVGASEGVAVGPAFVHAPAEPEPARKNISEDAVEEELERFRGAVDAVVSKLSETAERLDAAGNEEEAAIFEAHVELAEDPELASGVEERVRDLMSPEAAVLAVGNEHAEALSAMEDEYLSARADDVLDVASQIAAEMMGGRAAGLEMLEEPSVIVARSLAPSDTARIPRGMALGFVTAEGPKTSHVSIMARSMGVPAVVGVGVAALETALEARTIAVYGAEGYAVIDPDPDTAAEFEAKSEELAAEREILEGYKHVEARTRNGRRIEVAANLGSSSEAEGALAWGAEGVGLFRTEFLFMERPRLPSEDEQYEAYVEVARVFGERPVIVRTLDVGGDKDLPGVDQPEEDNLFKPQLRALLRAASAGNLRIMFPMIADVEEVRSAKRIFEECRQELQSEGEESGPAEIGVMIETPAAAIHAGELAPEVSFFSVGTNDLVQYTLAADRGNERLRKLQRADHPAVLELMGMTC